jgi:hypothetical protein
MKPKTIAIGIGIALGIALGLVVAAISEELRTIGTIQVAKQGSDLIIRVPYHEPKPSGSGKHMTIASGRTTVSLDGRPVIVQVTAYTPEAQ